MIKFKSKEKGEKIMEKKITKRDNFNALLGIAEVQANADLVAFINKELALLDKKNASRKTEMTETQKENLALKVEIYDYMVEQGCELSCSAIAKQFALSTQRTSPILEKLIADGKITKEMKKRTNYFKVVA